MASNYFDGNRVFDRNLSTPLSLSKVQKIEEGDGFLGVIILCGDRLLVSKIGCLKCINTTNKESIWEYIKETPSSIGKVCDNNENLFITVTKKTLSLDVDSLKEIWVSDDEQAVHTISEKYLYTFGFDKKPKSVRCLSKTTGDLVWQFDNYEDYVNKVLGNNEGRVVIESERKLHVLDELSGKLLNEFDYSVLLNENFKERLAMWRNRPGAGNDSHKKLPYSAVGPCINNRLFLSVDIGVVLALNIETSLIEWVFEFPIDKGIKNTSNYYASSIVYKDGHLYFVSERGGDAGYLYSLDAGTGELIYKTDKKITPKGAKSSVMVGDLYVAGRDRYLTVYDTKSKKIIWEYEHDVPIFGSNPCVFDNGLVFGDNSSNSLYWFNDKQ
jgi:outer membrane protein assembly factor BamB